MKRRHPKVVVLSYDETCEWLEDCDGKEPLAIVSIGAPGTSPPSGFKGHKARLRLECHDTELEDLGPRQCLAIVPSPDGPMMPNSSSAVLDEPRFVCARLLDLDTICLVGAWFQWSDTAERTRRVGDGGVCAADCAASGTVLVHCHAGVSRSAAAALTLFCVWFGPGGESAALAKVFKIRPQAHPNRLFVRHADRLLFLDGALVRAVEGWSR